MFVKSISNFSSFFINPQPLNALKDYKAQKKVLDDAVFDIEHETDDENVEKVRKLRWREKALIVAVFKDDK